MPAEIKKEIQLEIAHVLFIDIVGYSKLSINEQRAAIDELNEVVRASEQFQKAEASDRLIKIPTGDGMALVFYTSPEAPAQCAIEISRVLKEHPRLQLRMGVHSGPVSGVIDVNGRANLAGAGLNIGQRVMDCGDAGHILLSKHVAEDLEAYEQWLPLLHDLGTCEVKHGVRVSVVNLYSEQSGNPALPKKFRILRKKKTRARWAVLMAALLALAAIGTVFVVFLRSRPPATLPPLEKSIAVLPFENLSEEKQNAYFADGVQDEILTDLAKIAELKVISRASVMQYKSGVARNLRQIAQELGVANVLKAVFSARAIVCGSAHNYSMREGMFIYGPNTTTGRWMMYLQSRAKLPRRLLTNCAPSFRRKKRLRSRSHRRRILQHSISIRAPRRQWFSWSSSAHKLRTISCKP